MKGENTLAAELLSRHKTLGYIEERLNSSSYKLPEDVNKA